MRQLQLLQAISAEYPIPDDASISDELGYEPLMHWMHSVREQKLREYYGAASFPLSLNPLVMLTDAVRKTVHAVAGM